MLGYHGESSHTIPLPVGAFRAYSECPRLTGVGGGMAGHLGGWVNHGKLPFPEMGAREDCGRSGGGSGAHLWLCGVETLSRQEAVRYRIW